MNSTENLMKSKHTDYWKYCENLRVRYKEKRKQGKYECFMAEIFDIKKGTKFEWLNKVVSLIWLNGNEWQHYPHTEV